MRDEFDYHLPSKSYVQTCIQGYNDFGFDKKILNQALYDTIDNVSKKLKLKP